MQGFVEENTGLLMFMLSTGKQRVSSFPEGHMIVLCSHSLIPGEHCAEGTVFARVQRLTVIGFYMGLSLKAT